MYELEISSKAKKFIKKLKDQQLKRKFMEAIAQILESPLIDEMKKGDLVGIRCLDVRYNNSNYEIAYQIEENKVIIIVLIGTRENFYDELKKHLK